MHNLELSAGTPVCRATNLSCLHRIMAKTGVWTEVGPLFKIVNAMIALKVLDTKTNETRSCLSACEDLNFNDVTVSSGTFPSRTSFLFSSLSCVVAGKLRRSCEDPHRAARLQQQHPGLCYQVNHMLSTEQNIEFQTKKL